MNIEIHQIITWLIVGALAGWFVGTIVKRNKHGFGYLTNLGIGLAGALLGGFVFSLTKVDFGLGQITVSLRDLVSAVLGSFVLLIVVWIYRRFRKKKPAE